MGVLNSESPSHDCSLSYKNDNLTISKGAQTIDFSDIFHRSIAIDPSFRFCQVASSFLITKLIVTVFACSQHKATDPQLLFDLETETKRAIDHQN